VFLLIFDKNDLEAVIAMLELMLKFALLSIVLEKLRYLNILLAIYTVSYVFALLC
jgi:hypothetical protein